MWPRGCGRGLLNPARTQVALGKQGAAIPLDEGDKRLLNLMQGSFPIARRPYQHVAARLERPEQDVLHRVQELIDERIIRQVTPIFDTRALGYSSMLVAAKVDPDNPWRSASIINEHRAFPTITCAITSSTSGSRSPPSPIHRSVWSGRWRSWAGWPGRSRFASCPRCSCSRSAWTWRWKGSPCAGPGRRSRPRRRPSASLTTSGTWR